MNLSHFQQVREIDTVRTIFTQEELQALRNEAVPSHVAIIPDGNRRWAKGKSGDFATGHWEGASNLMDIVKAAKEIGIKTLTVWGFSTENWNRSGQEIEFLMHVMEAYISQLTAGMVKHKIRLDAIGDLEKLPPPLFQAFDRAKKATRHIDDFTLVLGMNYGGRDDICRAVKRLASLVAQGKMNQDEINEEMISKYLDTAQWPDPDLLIRTSGERRLSNFLLWQSSYSEIYVAECLWPEFGARQLMQAVRDFQQRNRRYGE